MFVAQVYALHAASIHQVSRGYHAYIMARLFLKVVENSGHAWWPHGNLLMRTTVAF
jgi:hypothetical protein